MEHLNEKKIYTGPVKAVVFDWAGTTIDFGCMGPAAVFVDVFKHHGIRVSITEARQFMGIAKKDHIQRMCELPSVMAAWNAVYHRVPDQAVVDRLYAATLSMMVKTVAAHCTPIDGVADTMGQLRSMDIKIGSTTGYVKEIMDVIVPRAASRGYQPDAIVCSSDVPAGRPFPWMCYLNAIHLGTYPMAAMVKVGDTLADINEGLNAGMWTVGITKTGNELGMTVQEIKALDPDTLFDRLSSVRQGFLQAGAHYIIDQVSDILPVIEQINRRLNNGDPP